VLFIHKYYDLFGSEYLHFIITLRKWVVATYLSSLDIIKTHSKSDRDATRALFIFKVIIIIRKFISDRYKLEVQNYYILKIFLFINNDMGTSTPIIKSFRPILLTVITFFKTYRFLYIKILIFLIKF
jgi:hypothetical protein